MLRDIAASRRSKNIPVFWKLFRSILKKKEKPIRMMGSKQGGQSVLISIFYVIDGHIIKLLTFLELVRILNPSVP
ncbi:MAG TPA: hypothetical protein ENI06_11955 [Spirochaetales bacterium]|nr:hypothetical protein [Spirochaetales bacterium]